MPELFEYQQEGVEFLLRNQTIILADEMGLGKTAQAINAATVSAVHGKVLIICPATLKWVWRKEFLKWSPIADEDIEVYDGKQVCANSKVTIINFEAAILERNHPVLIKAGWDTIIVDEAHRLKNRKAKQTKGIKAIKAPNVYLLTATPILNKPDEMWSLLNYLRPKEYSSFWRFSERYTIYQHNGFGKEVVGYRNLESLRDELSNIMIRRTKEEVIKGLPPKIHKFIPVELGKEQRRAYNEMAQDYLTFIDGKTLVAAVSSISQLTKLKQIATDPSILTQEHRITLPSAKMEVLKILVDDLLATEGRKVIVFSQWSRVVSRVSSAMKAAGIEYVTLTGANSDSEREAASERFQNDPSCRVFISTIGAGGFGLTLTAADSLIFTDRLWTPAYNEQAEDRAYARLNDLHGATVYVLVGKDTIEEHIGEVLTTKEDIVRTVMSKGIAALI